jgi:hypothetical protein
LWIPFFLFLTSCASKPTYEFPVPVEKPPAAVAPEEPQSTDIVVDVEGLQRYLKLEKSVDNLGYTEKGFSTCEVGYGYSSNRNCRRDYFVLIHFQLMCRDSNEDSYTEALGASDMRPLKGRTVKWTLDKDTGIIYLDDRGNGQIKTTTRTSPKLKRLKLNIDNDNLYVKAGEISKIVTPSNWCNWNLK